MTLINTSIENLKPGDDCRKQFQIAYNNRYTWPTKFEGYQGLVEFKDKNRNELGNFIIDSEFKGKVFGITDQEIINSISTQLWEVCIHRVKREFDDVHGANTFTVGNTNEHGTEVLVGGKSEGDSYRINKSFFSMVHRNIHGKIVTIYTEKIIDTSSGYLSERYNSQYSDKLTSEVISKKYYFSDEFIPLDKNGPWVLSKRIISEGFSDSSTKTEYKFKDMKKIN